jgi:3-deoxy-7-phosphoheptulonate synthase
MIVVLRQGVTEQELKHVIEVIEKRGLKAHVSRGVERTIIGCIGDDAKLESLPLQAIPGVERVMPVLKPYRMASREACPQGTVVKAGGGKTPVVEIGGGTFAVMAGPCTVESGESVDAIAAAVKKAGAVMLRGGAFKPRTSPYAFQ